MDEPNTSTLLIADDDIPEVTTGNIPVLSSWVLALFFAYGLPIYLCNLRIIWVLFSRRQKYISSYYTIFLFSGCNDAALYFINNYMIRLPSYPWLYIHHYSKYADFTYTQSVCYFVLVFTSYFTNFSCFLLSLNRLTAVWRYSTYEKGWQRWYPYALAGSCIGTLLLMSPLIGVRIRFELTDLGNGVHFVHFTTEQTAYLEMGRQLGAAAVPVFTAVGLVLDICTIALWWKGKALIPLRHRAYQTRLVFLTIAIYGIHLASTIFNMFDQLAINDRYVLYMMYEVVSDIMALLPTFFILIASAAVREDVFDMLLLWKLYEKLAPPTSGSNVSVISTNPVGSVIIGRRPRSQPQLVVTHG